MQPDSNSPQPATPGWEYKPNGAAEPSPQPQQFVPPPETQEPASPQKPADQNSISWTASEFIAHQKGFGWYALVVLAGAAAALLAYFITRDMISAVIIVIVMILLAALAGRKPRTLPYQIDDMGIHIGSRTYPYSEFKSFSVIDEGVFNSIALMPLKRFMPSISVYFEPTDEPYIVEVLSSYLPFQEGQKDSFDRFLHKIRF